MAVEVARRGESDDGARSREGGVEAAGGEREPNGPSIPVRTYGVVFLAAFAVAVLLRVLVIHAYRIPSSSMEDTLLVGDYLLAERLTYGATVELPWSRRPLVRLRALRRPERGDIVIFRAWGGPRQEFIKRCVALAGDTVEVRDNVLFVNGAPFDSLLARRFDPDSRTAPRIKHSAGAARHTDLPSFSSRLRDFGPHVVQPGHIFAVGDNRNNSDDSRTNGDVPLSALRGRPLVIYWSMNQQGGRRNLLARVRWSRIGRLPR